MKPKGITRRNLLLLWRLPEIDHSEKMPVAAPTPSPSNVRKRLQPLVALTMRPTQKATEAAFILRPPGALPEAEFIAACQRCSRCVDACPAQAITPTVDGSGTGTPHIDPTSSPCVLCTELKCTHACPSGALQPLTALNDIRMGTARIEAALCTAWRGLPCRICYDVCPIPGVLILTIGESSYVPVAGDSPCVGCGICQYYCPAEGAIRIVPRRDDTSDRVQIVLLNAPESTGESDAG